MVDKLPLLGVLAPEEQHRAASVRGAVAHHGVVRIVFPPDLGVAEIVHTAALGQVLAADHGVEGVLFISSMSKRIGTLWLWPCFAS